MLGCWDYKICCEPDRCMCWQWSALYPALLWAASTLCWLRWLGVISGADGDVTVKVGRSVW